MMELTSLKRKIDKIVVVRIAMERRREEKGRKRRNLIQFRKLSKRMNARIDGKIYPHCYGIDLAKISF